jgi:DNA-binding CsgD family transcriptional regulator
VAAAITLALTDAEDALAVCDRSVADAHRRGSLFAAAGAHAFRGFTLLRRGDLADAEDSLRTSFDEVEMWGLEPGRPYVSAFLADTLTERGDLAGAQAALDRGGITDPVPAAIQTCWWAVARVRLLLAEGRAADALMRADELSQRIQQVAPSPASIPWRSLRAEALDRLGRTGEAIACAADEAEIARGIGAPGALGRALRVLGTAKRDDGLPELDEAVAVLEPSTARLELAKALAARGAALRRLRRPSDAREPLRRALELASVCGADPLAEHARSELHAAGARPRTDAATGVESLTASERRVVDLAIEGGSNREIAQALYVTPKTVEVHLSNAYRKLGVRGRRELANVLSPPAPAA